MAADQKHAAAAAAGGAADAAGVSAHKGPAAAAGATVAAPASTAESAQQKARRGKRGWNVLVAPCALGDPVTAFEVDIKTGYLITGTGAGVVTAWRIDHLLDLYELLPTASAAKTPANGDVKQSAAAAATPATPAAAPANGAAAVGAAAKSSVPKEVKMHCTVAPEPAEFVATQLAKYSDEGVRDLYFEADRLYAVIGDVYLRYWDAIPGSGSAASQAAAQAQMAAQSQFGALPYDLSNRIKFRRAHNLGICSQTFTFRAAPHHILLVQTGSSQEYAWLIDTQTNDQTELRLYGSGNAQPQDTPATPGQPQPQRPAAKPATIAPATPLFADAHRLVSLEPPQAHSGASAQPIVRVWDWRRNVCVATFGFRHAHKFYWGFQLSGHRMVHVCCRNKLKVWDLQSPANYAYKMEGHTGDVLSFTVRLLGEEVISLGTDRKIKIWRGPHCVRNFKGVAGRFSCGYPYALRMVEFEGIRRRPPAAAASNGAARATAKAVDSDEEVDAEAYADGDADAAALADGRAPEPLSAAERRAHRRRQRRILFYSADDGVYALVVA